MSDNGPQFARAEFIQSAETWEFKHTTSSSGYLQSNGQSEQAIQTIKKHRRAKEILILLFSKTEIHPWMESNCLQHSH